MALRDWLHSDAVATATVATTATKPGPSPRSVASVASVAVAAPPKNNHAPAVAVDINTPTGHQDAPPITGAGMYQGKPTEAALDIADAILDHLAGVGTPEAESSILAAVGSDETMTRNVLYRLAAEGVVESLRGGRYRIPDHPPATPDLPERCPLRGGPVPDGCRFEEKLFHRMVREGTLPLPGGRCPLRHTCNEGGCC